MDQAKSSLNNRTLTFFTGGVSLNETVDSFSQVLFALGGSNFQFIDATGSRANGRIFLSRQIRVRRLVLSLDAAGINDTVSAITLATQVAGATAVPWASTTGATSIANLSPLVYTLTSGGQTSDLIVPALSSFAVLFSGTTSTVTGNANIGISVEYYLDS